MAIQLGSTLALIAWGLYWKPARLFTLAVAALTVLALGCYGTDYGLRQERLSAQIFPGKSSGVHVDERVVRAGDRHLFCRAVWPLRIRRQDRHGA
ncbi:MAG: hypothetical protein MZV65_20230 [Chromatiales bacterium]|nr:hypothetical protein [Chromatiales bacterium]